MDDQPGHPGEEAAELQSAKVCDRGGAADRRQRSFVAVFERAQRLTFDRAIEIQRGVLSLLDRGRGDAGCGGGKGEEGPDPSSACGTFSPLRRGEGYKARTGGRVTG